MRWDEKGIEGTHQEMIDWLSWFAQQQAKAGLPADDANRLGQTLAVFFQSGPEFVKVCQGALKCPDCHGRGHSNLFELGSKTPSPCTTCEGTGYAVKH